MTSWSLADTDDQALLEGLIAAAPVGLALWDADMRYRRVNETLAAMNGLAAEEHVGRTPSGLLGPLGETVETLFRRILDDGETIGDLEMTGETPARPGTQRTWLTTYSPVRDADATVIGIIGTVVEITATRSAEARADHTAAILESLFGAAPTGLALLGRDLRFERVNDAFAMIDGHPAHAYVGRHAGEVLGDVASELAAALAETLATGAPHLDIATATPAPDGSQGVRRLESSCFPLSGAPDELLGVGVVVRDVTERHEAEAERTRLLRETLEASAVAAAAQVRAEDARLQAEGERARTAFLARAGRRMAVSLDFETTLREVARAAVPDVADHCEITVAQPGGALLTLAADRTGGDGSARPIALDDNSRAAEVIRTGRVALVNVLGARRVLIVPLRSSGRTLGALTFVHDASDRLFSDRDVALARALAARAALHLENARLYTERSHIADTLQRSLLPRSLPEVPGLELAARYRAAGEINDVGGDFYDVFPTGDGSWTAIIGDVTGKGAGAAALTSMARYTLRAATRHSADGCAQLSVLNETMLAEADQTRFATVLTARLEPDATGTSATLTTGGHPPPFLVRADGSVELVDVSGTLVGALPDAHFGTADVRLGARDTLVLYTDGALELRGVDATEGERRLATALEGAADSAPADLLAAIEAVVTPALRDDLALMAIRAAP